MVLNKSRKAGRKFIALDLLFVIYCVIMFGIIYLPLTINYSKEPQPALYYNYIPFINSFRSIFQTRSGLSFHSALVTCANFAIFIPMSAYLVVRHGNRYKRNLILIVSISICAEIVQLLLIPIVGYQDHVIDIDDIILNFAGAVVAFFIFNRIGSKRNGPYRVS